MPFSGDDLSGFSGDVQSAADSIGDNLQDNISSFADNAISNATGGLLGSLNDAVDISGLINDGVSVDAIKDQIAGRATSLVSERVSERIGVDISSLTGLASGVRDTFDSLTDLDLNNVDIKELLGSTLSNVIESDISERLSGIFDGIQTTDIGERLGDLLSTPFASIKELGQKGVEQLRDAVGTLLDTDFANVTQAGIERVGNTLRGFLRGVFGDSTEAEIRLFVGDLLENHYDSFTDGEVERLTQIILEGQGVDGLLPGVRFGVARRTAPRFPLPDVAQEVIRAGRYGGPLIPGAADQAAKLLRPPTASSGGGLFSGVSGLLDSATGLVDSVTDLASNIDLETVATVGISATTGISPTTIQTGISLATGDITNVEDFGVQVISNATGIDADIIGTGVDIAQGETSIQEVGTQIVNDKIRILGDSLFNQE